MSSIKLSPNASGTGEFTIAAPNSNTNRTLTLPDQTGTVLTNAGPFTANASASNGAVTIDASNNVGVGTSSPTALSSYRTLDVRGSSGGGFRFGNSTDSGYIYSDSNETNIASATSKPLLFSTNTTERARINSVGQFGIGFSAPNANLVVGGAGGTGWVAGARNTLQLRNSNGGGNQSNFIVFGSAASETYCTIGNDINANGTTVNQLNIQAGSSGGVYLANGGTSWTSSSDERVKDIIEPITDAAAKVSTLRAVIGKYKNDDDGTRRSFLIAQDVQAVLPEAITVGADENNTLGLSYTDTIPLLVAAIQELNAKVAALEARLASDGPSNGGQA